MDRKETKECSGCLNQKSVNSFRSTTSYEPLNFIKLVDFVGPVFRSSNSQLICGKCFTAKPTMCKTCWWGRVCPDCRKLKLNRGQIYTQIQAHKESQGEEKRFEAGIERDRKIVKKRNQGIGISLGLMTLPQLYEKLQEIEKTDIFGTSQRAEMIKDKIRNYKPNNNKLDHENT